MQAIVAVDRNWGIGYKGSLLVSIPNDHKMFRQATKGKTIIYGRKTLETFPLAQPLDQRRNVILSRNPGYSVRNAEVVHSVEELMELLKDENPEDLMVIGGASVYKELLPYCDTVHVTMIDYAYEADAFFPNLDKDPEWKMTMEGEEQTYFDIPYTFVKYERVKASKGPHGSSKAMSVR